MKKLILLLIFIDLSSIECICQNENIYQKGTFLTGGSVSVDFGNVKEFVPATGGVPELIYTTKNKDFETNIYLGYFLFNKFTIGFKSEISFGESILKSNLEPGNIWDIKNHKLLLGPFIRYYIYSGFFAESNFGFGFIHTSANGPFLKQKCKEWTFGLGYDIHFNSHVALEPIVKYGSLWTKIPYENKKQDSKNLMISLGLQIFLNVQAKNVPNQ